MFSESPGTVWLEIHDLKKSFKIFKVLLYIILLTITIIIAEIKFRDSGESLQCVLCVCILLTMIQIHSVPYEIINNFV